jgi:hypothetical protein
MTLKDEIAKDLIKNLSKSEKEEVLVIGLTNAYTTEQLYYFLKNGYKTYPKGHVLNEE